MTKALSRMESSSEPEIGRVRGKLFMLVAQTPLSIDLFGEWSANTEKQTCNGTINELGRLYHSVPGVRLCVEP